MMLASDVQAGSTRGVAVQSVLRASRGSEAHRPCSCPRCFVWSTIWVRLAGPMLRGRAAQQCISAGQKTRPYSGRCFGSAAGGQGSAQSRPSHTGGNGKFTFGCPAWAACGTKSEAEIWPQFLSRDLAPLGSFSGNPVSTFGAAWGRNFASAGAPFWRARWSPL